ncbi:MAG: putative LPS assembly protein LptD [Saprospiraceae bacterium]
MPLPTSPSSSRKFSAVVFGLGQFALGVCVSVCLLLISAEVSPAFGQISADSIGKVNALNGLGVDKLLKSDTLEVHSLDLFKTRRDSNYVDSLGTDSLALDSIPVRTVYSISPNALEGLVKYSMRDSMRYSIREQKIYLYGDARVEYADLILTSGYMVIDYASSIVVAEPITDSLGALTELPNFEQGAQKFEAKGMRYNFKTRKGIIYNATTKQGDLYVLGGKTKLVAADERDPIRADNVVYNSDAIFTTCDLDHPHYGIRSNKQKIIPGKQVIVGPSNVELGGIPTPLWLPFGFFPIGTSERSGLIFPANYTYFADQGFGFQDVGWYFPWNDNIHTSATVDVFLKGTTRGYLKNNYNKRYRYSGSLDLGYSRNRAEILGEESFSDAFSFNWRHAQDAKANPYRSFRADVELKTNNFDRANNPGFDAQLTGTIRSTLAYTFKFPEHKSWNLTTGFNHSQNTVTRQVNMSLPDMKFSTGSMYPFANLGTKSTAWYKKAQLTYSAQVKGSIVATDTTLFKKEVWDNALFGGSHGISFNAPVNVLKYFRLSPNISYNEVYYLDEVRRTYEQTDSVRTVTEIILGEEVTTEETISFGEVTETIDGVKGFPNAARTFNANVSLSTQIFGTARFNAGPLKGVRHIITPSIRVGFSPDYSDRPFNYYRDVQVNPEGEFDAYDIFPNQPFSPGAISEEQSLQVGYTLGNRIETKMQGRKDSVSRIVSVINNLSFSGSYNLETDTLQWSPISVSGAQATFFKKLIRINFGGGLDVYALDANRNRSNETLIKQGKGPFRIDRFNFAINAGASLGQIRELIVGKENKLPANSIFGLVQKFRVSYNYSRAFAATSATPWSTRANSINASGGVQITDKWSVSNLTVGYDISNERITYPTLGLRRDLHCWEMDFFYSPAFNNTFTFSIRVKPSSLSFLELPYRRSQF